MKALASRHARGPTCASGAGLSRLPTEMNKPMAVHPRPRHPGLEAWQTSKALAAWM